MLSRGTPYQVRPLVSNGSQRNYCFVINNIHFDNPANNLCGYVIDGENIKETFGELKFKLMYREDVKANDIIKQCEVWSREDFSNTECIVMFILSHGYKYGIIYGTDGKEVNIDDIISKFRECKQLENKPKLIFIQACRGEGYQVTESKSVQSCDGGAQQTQVSDVNVSVHCHEEVEQQVQEVDDVESVQRHEGEQQNQVGSINESAQCQKDDEPYDQVPDVDTSVQCHKEGKQQVQIGDVDESVQCQEDGEQQVEEGDVDESVQCAALGVAQNKKYRDTCVHYCTTDGYLSWVYPITGTAFITEVCNAFRMSDKAYTLMESIPVINKIVFEGEINISEKMATDIGNKSVVQSPEANYTLRSDYSLPRSQKMALGTASRNLEVNRITMRNQCYVISTRCGKDNCGNKQPSNKATTVKERFEDLKFDTSIYTNMGGKEIEEHFEKIKKTDFSGNDCLVHVILCCVGMSGQDEVIYGSDGEPVDISWILRTVKENETLQNVPKLFFMVLNICNGGKHQQSICPDVSKGMADTFLYYIIVKDPRNAADFLTRLCDTLVCYTNENMHLIDAVVRVNEMMGKDEFAVPEACDSLTKLVYLSEERYLPMHLEFHRLNKKRKEDEDKLKQEVIKLIQRIIPEFKPSEVEECRRTVPRYTPRQKQKQKTEKGKVKPGKVIVKFTSIERRNEVYAKKEELCRKKEKNRKNNMCVYESYPKHVMNIIYYANFPEVKEGKCITNVSCEQGHITVQINNKSEKITINSIDDIKQLDYYV